MTATRTRLNVLPLLLAAALAATPAGTGAAGQSFFAWQSAVGYEKLALTLGPATPVGAGVAISIVEAASGGNYFPLQSDPAFGAADDPLGQAVTFIDGSMSSTGVSDHANNVANWVVGNLLSLSKGANTVTMYNADMWLNNQLRMFKTPAQGQVPEVQPFKVQNHSWIGSFGSTTNDLLALRKFDFMIERDDVTAVVGLNNNPINLGATPPNTSLAHPNFWAHSFNAIAVGRSNGKHSRGVTNSIYGPGRYRPDIVVPVEASGYNSVSAATAGVSSAAALLRGVAAGTDADRSETMKAILMAGATKTEFLPGVVGSPNGPSNALGFVEPATGLVNNWSRTPTQPLDDIFGAGELNVYNSYLMLVGGRHAGSTAPPTTVAKSYGWDYQDRKADATVGDIYYSFEIPVGSTATEFSTILAWNVRVTSVGGGGVFDPSHSLQNLDLRLYDSTTSFLGTMLDESVSTVDNVEHIYQTNLGPGLYTLVVSGAASWDYGLAWRMSTKFDEPNADFDGDGTVGGADFLIWQRNLGKLVGALQSEGDANGDGAVDLEDLQLLSQGAMPTPMMQAALAAAAMAAPEPSAGVVAWSMAAMGVYFRRRRRSYIV